MPQWTSKQLSAIMARNRSILVSAAAGSGKTAVLIERVMQLLREGQDIDGMLVVTFTRAAATEMRDRLLRSLTPEAKGNKALKTQRDKIGNADISTLHQFCIRLISRHFQAVGADPQSKVGDEGFLKEKLKKALQEEMESLYENPDADGLYLIDTYHDFQIEDMFYRLYAFLMAQEAPWQWLKDELLLSAPDDLRTAPWYQTLLTESRAQAESAVALSQACIDLAAQAGGPRRYLPAAQADLAMAGSVLKCLQSGESLPPEWTARFVRLSTAKAPLDENEQLKEAFKTLRDAAKSSLERAISLLPRGDEALEKAKNDILLTHPALRALCGLTRRVHLRYGELKREKQRWDYADLEHLALACLKDEGVRYQVHRQYQAIFVDEYQDISRIQEAIIRHLQGDDASLFMVGDVKQSIYRFRLADPMLFLHKYSSFEDSPEADRRVITLSQNFRSRDNILLSVNHVFDHALKGGALEIDYDSQAQLYPGGHSLKDPPCELHLVLPAQGEEEVEGEQLCGSEREALLIARRIGALRGTFISDGDKQRPLSFRDMVILLRSASGRAEKMADVLRSQGIPVYSDADSQFFDLIEVSDFLNLLHVLDNPYDDERLLSVLSAPPFQFGPQDLIRIRESGDKNQAFYLSFFALAQSDPQIIRVKRQLDAWRLLSQNLPLEGFVRRLLRETGIYARAGAKPQGELRRANLRLLCERASANPDPQTLHGFLNRVTQARKQDNTRAAATLGAGEDVVRIMTVHKSKGLEFPVVFLPDLGHRFRLGGQGELLLMDSQDGLALKVVNQEKRLTYHTLAGKAIQIKKDRQTRSEEARLLYVAMTRAKERLILLSAPSSLSREQKRWAMAGRGEGPGKAANMLEWVGGSLSPALQSGEDSLYTAQNGSRWQILYHAADQLIINPQPSVHDIPSPDSLIPGEKIKKLLSPLILPESFPLKMSVSQLVKLQVQTEEETRQSKRQSQEVFSGLLKELRPQSALSGAERGIATHKALGGFHLACLRGLAGEALKAALRLQLDDMVANGRLDKAQAQAVDVPRAAGFYESPIGNRLLNSKEVHREWPFSLVAEQGLIVQGVIDCCFMENEGWVLMDYKTDRAPAEVIHGRYRDQLRWYMRALSDITGVAVSAAYLYAIQLGQFIPVRQEEPIAYRSTEAGL